MATSVFLLEKKIIKIYFLTPGLLETEYVDPSPASGLYHSTDPPEQTGDLGGKLFDGNV